MFHVALCNCLILKLQLCTKFSKFRSEFIDILCPSFLQYCIHSKTVCRYPSISLWNSSVFSSYVGGRVVLSRCGCVMLLPVFPRITRSGPFSVFLTVSHNEAGVHVNTHTHTHACFCNFCSCIREEKSSENNTKLRRQLGSILVSYFLSPAFVS